MFIPHSFHPAPESNPFSMPENGSAALDSLSTVVVCRLCGTPVATMQELEVVASSAVHTACLRHMIVMGWQIAHNQTPDNSV